MDNTLVMLEPPAAIAEKWAQRSKELGFTSLEDLLLAVLQHWWASGGAPPQVETHRGEDKEVQYNERLAHLTACGLFLESLPNEVCIKKSDSTLVWCNQWYRNMAGGRQLPELVTKTPEEIWKDDPNRAHQIKQWDLQVLTNRAPVCHVDSLKYGDDIERPRIGIRFPMVADPTADIRFIGTLGIDFATMDAAVAARDAIRTEGRWDVRKKLDHK